MRRRTAWSLFIGTVALLSAASGLTAPAAAAGESSAPAVSTTPAAPDPAATATGFDPAQHVGRVVYLDFWASWCAPCKHSFPWMKELQTKYGERGFEVIAVNLDKKRETADEFLKKAEPNFQIVFDPEGKLAEQYELQGMPTTVLFDREGKMRKTHIGYREGDRETLATEIEALLAEPEPKPNPGAESAN